MMGHFMSSAEADFCHVVNFHRTASWKRNEKVFVLFNHLAPFPSIVLKFPAPSHPLILCGQDSTVVITLVMSALRQCPSATDLVTVLVAASVSCHAPCTAPSGSGGQ